MVRKFSPRRGANIVSVGSGQDCRGVGTPIRGVGAGLPWGANEFQRQLLLCELQRPSSIPATSVASGQDFHCCGAGLPLGSGQDFRGVGAGLPQGRGTKNPIPGYKQFPGKQSPEFKSTTFEKGIVLGL